MTIPYTAGALKLTAEQAAQLFTPEQIIAGEVRGTSVTRGPWGIIISYSALCTSNEWIEQAWGKISGPVTVYGIRTLTPAKESGYALEGKVSVNGRKYRGFTSSQLFELPDGKLINVATIHACGATKH